MIGWWWWQRIRLWFTWQSMLIGRAVALERELTLTQGRLRREQSRHAAEVGGLHAEVAALRREAESLAAANDAVIAQNRRERLFGNQLAHRNRAGFELADRLPADLAAELRAALAPRIATEETTHA